MTPPPTPGVYLVTTDHGAVCFAYWDGTAWPYMPHGKVAKWQEPPQRDAGIEPEVPNE